MDIKIRDVDMKYIEEIDRRCEGLSNKTGNKWSRNDYLKMLIKNDFHVPLYEYKKDQFDHLLEKFVEVQEQNTKTLEEYIKVTNKLIENLLTQSI